MRQCPVAPHDALMRELTINRTASCVTERDIKILVMPERVKTKNADVQSWARVGSY